MKILLVTFSNNADHQDITFGMFEKLVDIYPVWLMCIKTPRVKLEASERIKFVDCPNRPGICKKTFDLRELFSIIKWINKQEFDVIFFENLHTWNLAIMLLCHTHTKIYQMIHDLIPHDGDKNIQGVKLMNSLVCKLADKIVLCNKKYINEATKIYKLPKERVKFVDMWRRFPQYTEPKYTKSVLFFGRINPYKGAENLIEIVKKCPQVQFKIVGRIDDHMKETIELLKQQKNVMVNSGYVTDEEMRDAFTGSDWIILPYKSATQSGVIIDAYRYSRPVIAFDVGAISEQIIEGETGYLVEEGNNELFSRKILEAVNMEHKKYREISLNAYKFGLKKYAADGAINRFLKLIEYN